jgi:hypothetical protein
MDFSTSTFFFIPLSTLNLPDQLLMSRTPRLQSTPILHWATDNPRLKINNLLAGGRLGIVTRLADRKHSQRLCNRKEQKVVSKQTTGTDASAESIGYVARIWFGGFCEETGWVEC